MFLALCAVILASQDAFAQAAAIQQPSFFELLKNMLPMFAMVFLIFYFLVMKPQQKKLKDQQDLMQALKKGDSVVTTSGIVGKVSQLEDAYILLELAPNVRVKFERAHIVKKEEKEPAKSAA
jgi:preprotein translocase subunit YajC